VLPLLNNTATGTFFDRGGCAIVTGADLSSQEHQDPLPGYSTFFKVLICVNQDVWLNGSEHISCGHLHMFSSNESSWTKPRECFTKPYLKDLKMVGCAVVCRGMAHWLLRHGRIQVYAMGGSCPHSNFYPFVVFLAKY
jgi:hypothetical protein